MVDLDYIKRRGRMDDILVHEDDLRRLADAAEEKVVMDTGRTREELCGEGGELPALLQECVVLLTVHWWEHSSMTTPAEQRPVPYTYDAILSKYRKLTP